MLPTAATQHAEGRIGNYIHTAPHGRKYFPFDPRVEEVDIEMIAHHLATEARYGGATQHPKMRDRIFYSVAEHSVWVSRYIEEVLGQPEYALEGLLHDAPEGPIGDMIRPLKYSPELREPFKAVEDLNEKVMCEAFGLIYPFPSAVKKADETVCAAEIQQIVPRAKGEDWEIGKMHDDTHVAPYKIRMLLPADARDFFLIRYRQLMRVRSQYRAVPSHFAL